MVTADFTMVTKGPPQPQASFSAGSLVGGVRVVRATPHYPLRWSKLLEHCNVPPAVAFVFIRSFQNERLRPQFWMRENAAEALHTDVTFSDICMPVDMRPQRRFGIVSVNHSYVFQTQNALGLSHGFLQPRFAG